MSVLQEEEEGAPNKRTGGLLCYKLLLLCKLREKSDFRWNIHLSISRFWEKKKTMEEDWVISRSRIWSATTTVGYIHITAAAEDESKAINPAGCRVCLSFFSGANNSHWHGGKLLKEEPHLRNRSCSICYRLRLPQVAWPRRNYIREKKNKHSPQITRQNTPRLRNTTNSPTKTRRRRRLFAILQGKMVFSSYYVILPSSTN